MINWVSYTAKRTYLALSVKKDIYIYTTTTGATSITCERVLILYEIGLQGDYIYIGLRDQGSMV